MIEILNSQHLDELAEAVRVEGRRIIDAAVSSVPSVELPRVIHTAGIPGSGKTTYAACWIKTQTAFALVQFDGIMERLSGYQSDKRQLGLAKAFERWELPARKIGYSMLQALVAGRRNIFFDHSAASMGHIGLIQAMKREGYTVEMHHVQCPLHEAIARVRARSGRYTPEHIIHERQQLLGELIPTYRKLVDKFVSVESSTWALSAAQDSVQGLRSLVP